MTASTYNYIGNANKLEGNETKALEWYKKAFAICEKVLGAENQLTLKINNNIVDIISSVIMINKL